VSPVRAHRLALVAGSGCGGWSTWSSRDGALWGILCYFMCYFCYWNLSPMLGRLKLTSDQYQQGYSRV